MARKLSLLLGYAACGALLASCGGDDNPGGTPTPSPTATGTPTPSPTATPTPTAIDFDYAQDFVASTTGVYAFAYFTPNAGGPEVFSDANRLAGSSRITYDASPETVTFEFSTLSNAVIFAGADRTEATTTLRSYANTSGRLILELPFEYTLRASYQRSDPFTRDSVPGTLRSRRVALYLNPVTTSAAISGTLSYTGQPMVVGGTPGTTGPADVSVPQRSFTVTAGTTPSLSGSIPVFVNQNGTQTQIALLTFASTSTSASGFSGTVRDTGAGFSGDFVASFSGPNREELVIIFDARHASDGRKFVGSYIGAR